MYLHGEQVDSDNAKQLCEKHCRNKKRLRRSLYVHQRHECKRSEHEQRESGRSRRQTRHRHRNLVRDRSVGVCGCVRPVQVFHVFGKKETRREPVWCATVTQLIL